MKNAFGNKFKKYKPSIQGKDYQKLKREDKNKTAKTEDVFLLSPVFHQVKENIKKRKLEMQDGDLLTLEH